MYFCEYIESLRVGDTLNHFVQVVAHVTSVQINPARASFALEDGTGKIWAAKDFDSLSFESTEEGAEEDEIAQLLTL